MIIKRLENISKNPVYITMSDGSRVKLPVKGILENIEMTDITGIAKWVKITYNLSEVNP